MTIAITINTSWNIYNFRLGLIRHLISLGHRVIAIAPKDDFSQKLTQEGCHFVPVLMDNTGSNPCKDIRLLIALTKIYRTHQPDIIYHYTIKPNLYGTIAAKINQIPVINNVSGLGTVFLNSNFFSKIAKWLYKCVFKHAQLIFFQNPDDRIEFQSQIDIPNMKTDLLPGSGINLSQFSPVSIEPPSSTLFLMVARLIVEKGVMEYMHAAAIVKKYYPNVHIQLAGKYDSTHARVIDKKLLDQYTSEGIIDYIGEVVDVAPVVAQATCVVLPSYREGTPRSLLEAAAMQKPIITTNVPGCKEVIRDGESGLLCDAKDATDLANKMMAFCRLSTVIQQEMGKKGRKLVVDRFDERIVIEKYVKHTLKITNQILS